MNNKLLTKTLSVAVGTGLLVAGPLTANLNASELNASEVIASEVVTDEVVSSETTVSEVTVNETPTSEVVTDEVLTDETGISEVTDSEVTTIDDDTVVEVEDDKDSTNESADTSTDNVSSTNEIVVDETETIKSPRYITQNLNLSVHQGKLTYGDVFKIMNINFTDPYGNTFHKDELIGYQASGDSIITQDTMTYDQITDDIVNINWGHEGKYKVELQFDNSRFDDDGSTPYSYIIFEITIVGEEVMNKTYSEDYNGVKGNELITTWKNGHKESAILTDKNGRKVSAYEYFGGTNNIESRFDYDSKGNIKKKTYYTNNSKHSIDKAYTYDNPGSSKNYTRYEYSNGVKKYSYKYENGKRVNSYTYYTSGSAKGNVHYKYYWKTKSGKLVKVQRETRNTNAKVSERYYYADNGKVTKRYVYTNGSSKNYTRYEYSNGVKKYSYKYENGKRSNSYTYYTSGSAKGNVHYKYYWTTKSGHLVKTKRIEYSTSGKTLHKVYY